MLSKSSLEERRDNADIICLQLLVFLLDMKNYDGFVKQFRNHFHLYKNTFDQICQSAENNQSLVLSKIEEMKWRSNWHMMIAKMLESKPILFNDSQNIYQNQRGGGGKGKYQQGHWLSDT